MKMKIPANCIPKFVCPKRELRKLRELERKMSHCQALAERQKKRIDLDTLTKIQPWQDEIDDIVMAIQSIYRLSVMDKVETSSGAIVTVWPDKTELNEIPDLKEPEFAEGDQENET